MNQINFRNRKKGVTPVIATIILIAGTLVLALVVGAYTFGLFGSNVKIVTLTSGTLYGGFASATAGQTGSYISFSLNNPGSNSIITGLTITGSAITQVTAFTNDTAYANNAFLATCKNSGNNCDTLLGGQPNAYTWYLAGKNQPIITGQTYTYLINLQNGQSVSGSLIAQ